MVLCLFGISTLNLSNVVLAFYVSFSVLLSCMTETYEAVYKVPSGLLPDQIPFYSRWFIRRSQSHRCTDSSNNGCAKNYVLKGAVPAWIQWSLVEWWQINHLIANLSMTAFSIFGLLVNLFMQYCNSCCKWLINQHIGAFLKWSIGLFGLIVFTFNEH